MLLMKLLLSVSTLDKESGKDEKPVTAKSVDWSAHTWMQMPRGNIGEGRSSGAQLSWRCLRDSQGKMSSMRLHAHAWTQECWAGAGVWEPQLRHGTESRGFMKSADRKSVV